MENLIGNKLNPLKFQEKIIKKVLNKDALVSMPTNSGKTLVAYQWSNVLNHDFRKIIFTAPIKALSNERYRELKHEGVDVGLITGDVKWNQNADVLCMTQEIYSQGFYNRIADVIIDEFHYIFHNHDRARCYIESIEKTNKKSKILLMSATCHQPLSIAKYLNSLTDKKISVAETSERLVPLTFSNKGIKLKDIRDAIVFCFSRTAISKLLYEFIQIRKKIDRKKIIEISDLAYDNKIEFMPEWEYGVSAYHGKLLPKEKMFIEYLFRKGYIDVVVGTDALALGVNLPAKYIVIAQTYKPTNKHLEPSEFLQLAGRAGRYGYHDEGIVTWLEESPVEIRGINTKKMFDWLKDAELEPVEIEVEVDITALLNGRHAEEEAQLMLKYMYSKREKEKGMFKKYLEQIILVENEIKKLRKQILLLYGKEFYDHWNAVLNTFYLEEWDLSKNARVAEIVTQQISKTGKLNVLELVENCISNEKCLGEQLQELLLLNKWINRINEHNFNYMLINTNTIIDIVNSLDHTVFRPDLIL